MITSQQMATEYAESVAEEKKKVVKPIAIGDTIWSGYPNKRTAWLECENIILQNIS